MESLGFNLEQAVAVHDTLVEMKNILTAAPCEGFQSLVNEVVSDLDFGIEEIQLNIFDRAEEVTGEPVVPGGHSLVVSKAEHDRVLEQLKRYSGE